MIAIVGGGPAGIALAAALDRRKISYDLFEGHQIASTWRATPDGLRVLSPWWTNVLRVRDVLNGNPFRKPSAADYLNHLLKVADSLKGRIHERNIVLSLDPAVDKLWHLNTNAGVYGPYRFVVLATGYFSSPRPPEPCIKSDRSIPSFHAASIRDYSELEKYRKGISPIVIVGRRVTAGQLMLELVERNIPCAISVRSPLEFRRHGLVATVRETAYFFWEELQAMLQPGLRRPSFPVMDGGRSRELLESGKVPVLSVIERIEEGRLVLVDGRKVSAAALIFATGYLPTLSLLSSPLKIDAYGIPEQLDFELKQMPGVHLLGFDNIYDHRSRYLRGIRLDAVRLAEKLVSACDPAN